MSPPGPQSSSTTSARWSVLDPLKTRLVCGGGTRQRAGAPRRRSSYVTVSLKIRSPLWSTRSPLALPGVILTPHVGRGSLATKLGPARPRARVPVREWAPWAPPVPPPRPGHRWRWGVPGHPMALTHWPRRTGPGPYLGKRIPHLTPWEKGPRGPRIPDLSLSRENKGEEDPFPNARCRNGGRRDRGPALSRLRPAVPSSFPRPPSLRLPSSSLVFRRPGAGHFPCPT